MFINRPVLGLIGSLILIAALGEPVLGQPAQAPARAPIEFRLHHPDSSASTDVDIWAPADARVIIETQAEISAIRQTLSSPIETRHAFSDVVLTGVSMLPVVGQFTNRDWMKGFVTLGTAAGLTTAIVLGNHQNNPELVRLGTLGLYPLVVFGSLDAYFTRVHRDQPQDPRP